MLTDTVDAERVEIALQDFQQWLWAWHRAMICNLPFKRLVRDTAPENPQDCLCNVERFVREAEGVLNGYPAYQNLSRLHDVLHELADSLAHKATAKAEPVGVVEYDQLVSTAMQIIEAFTTLIFQMKKEERRQKALARRGR